MEMIDGETRCELVTQQKQSIALQMLSNKSTQCISARNIDTKKILLNKPYREFIFAEVPTQKDVDYSVTFLEFAKNFILNQFYSVFDEFEISDVLNSEDVEKIFDTYIAVNQSMNSLKNLAIKQKKYYTEIIKYIHTLHSILPTNNVNNINISGIAQTFECFKTMSSIDEKIKFAEGLNKVEDIKKIQHIPTVIPIKFIKEIVLTFPVWYFNSNRSEITNYFSHQLIATLGQNFLDLFSYFNGFQRSMVRYDRDPLPLSTAKSIDSIRNYVDNTVIATPFLDVYLNDLKSREPFPISPDPLLLGWFHNSPYLIIYRRWAGNGIFPSSAELMEQTIQFISTHKQLIAEKFEEKDLVRINDRGGYDSRSTTVDDHVTFFNNMISSYEEGKLFDFI